MHFLLVIRLSDGTVYLFLIFLSASCLQLALTTLQTKAETEISKAQKLILEKDAELSAVEESFAELKEVTHMPFLLELSNVFI